MKTKELKKVKCECCGKEMDKTSGGLKRCSACSLHNRELRERIYYYKNRYQRLTKKFYGQKEGNQRLRFKEKEE